MAIGSVSVNVVPDATGFWRRFEAQTGNRPDETVRVRADTTQARAQLDALNKSSSKASFEMHALRDAAVLLGPSLVPVAGIAAGAFAGLIPVLAAVGLGVKGIVDDYKNGSLQASKFGGEVSTLTGELHQLEQLSAGGLLNGLQTTMKSLHPAFEEINRDTAAMSQQFGQVLGHATAGFITLLTDLNPLFVTFGDQLVRGATAFQHWAGSSDAVSKFVAYVQSELPTVEHALGQLVELAGRLIAGLAPLGHVALSTIGVLAQTLNALPLDVLSKLETGAIAVYAAFRTYGAITGIVNRVSAAIASNAAAQEAAEVRAEAASLAQQAAVTEEAAVFAEAKATEARAAAATALQIATSVEGTGSVLEAGSLDAAIAADEFAAAMEAEAASARAAATQIAASSESAAAAAAGVGEAATVGWSAALGPIGAVAAGVGILAATLLSSSSSTRQATQDTNDYTNALLQSNGVINQNIRAIVAKKLADEGVLDAARELGIKLPELTSAILGNGDAASQVRGRLDAVAKGFANYSGDIVGPTGKASDLNDALNKVNAALGTQSSSIKDAIRQYREIHSAEKQAADGANSVALAHHRSADALHVLVDAYNAAQTAAKKSTQQARAQTLQFQLENDAASLLDQSLQKLAGHGLSMAEAQTALRQANLAVRQSFKENKTAIEGGSAAAVANQQALQGQAQAAIQVAEQVGKATKSSKDEVASLKDSKAAIEDQLRSRNKLTPAVQAYIDKLYDLKNLKVPPTVLDVKKQAADQAIAALKKEINNIRQDHSPELTANPGIAENAIRELQHEIDQIRQGHVPPINVDTSGANSALNVVIGQLQTIGRGANATVTVTTPTGTLHIPQAAGTRSAFGRDTIPPNTAFTVGERGWEGGVTDAQGRASIFSHEQALAMGFSAPTGYASGTSPSTYIVDGTRYASLESAKNAARTDFHANVRLGIEIEHQGFNDWRKALAGTVSQAHAAFAKIISETRKLGVSDDVIKHLEDQDKRLDRVVAARNELQRKLGTAPSPPTEYDKLANAISKVRSAMQAMHQEAQQVAAAVRSVFDITTAGTGPNGNRTPTGDSILAQQAQAAAKARLFVRDIKDLSNKIPGPYLNELAQQGPDALPQVEALKQLSNSQLRELAKTQRQINQSARGLGQFISVKDDKADVKAAEKQRDQIKNHIKDMKDQIHHDQNRIHDRLVHMEDELSKHIDEQSHHAIVITDQEGKVLWKFLEKVGKKGSRPA